MEIRIRERKKSDPDPGSGKTSRIPTLLFIIEEEGKHKLVVLTFFF
jgi:hypothetical protein